MGHELQRLGNGSGMPRGEAWRLLVTWRGEPGWNMGLDEVLLESDDPRPTLRFYTWEPAALSLGYFQRWRELEGVAQQRVVVRRFSGGGAIHHRDELTFSIAASQDHPLFRGEVRLSYERIHALLARAFEPHGIQARLRGAGSVRSDRAGTGMCFHESTALDLVWGERKGVGSAQRRRGGRVLHHGSIKLGESELEPGVAALAGTPPEILARDLETTFERALGCRFEREEPSADEQARASLRAAFYRSEAFLRRR